MKRETVTISISIPADILAWVDEQAKAWKVSRSYLIANLLGTTKIRCSDEYEEGSNEH